MKIEIRNSDGTYISLDTGNIPVRLTEIVNAGLDVWNRALPMSRGKHETFTDADVTRVLPTYKE